MPLIGGGATSAEAAGLGVSVGTGHGIGVSASVSVGSVSTHASGATGATPGAAGAVSASGAVAGASVSVAPSSVSAAAHVTAPAASAGIGIAAAGRSAVGAVFGGIAGRASVDDAPSAAVAGAPAQGAVTPGTSYGETAAALSTSPVAPLVGDAVGDFEAPVPAQTAEAGTVILRGVGTLGPRQRVDCTSRFCITHLRRVSRVPTRIMLARDKAERWRSFDDVIRAAEAGQPDAEFIVAEVLSGGHGVAADLPRAAVWYERAAAHGDTLAVSRLNRLRASLQNS